MRLTVPLLLLAALAAGPAGAEPRLSVRLVFDAATSARLTASGEKVIVAAWFYGDPASRSVPVDEMGLVNIAQQEVTVEPRDQVVPLGERVQDGALAKAVKPYVNVNVYSARLTDGNNLLDCGIVDDALGAVAGRDNVIECRLLD